MMKNFVNKENLNLRLMQLFILVAHIVLLKWILYTLYEGGVLPFKILMYHFLGISVYGGLLIRFCAWYYKRQYLKELEKDGREPTLEK
jgi:apolipoprotein N-acyltransferase